MIRIDSPINFGIRPKRKKAMERTGLFPPQLIIIMCYALLFLHIHPLNLTASEKFPRPEETSLDANSTVPLSPLGDPISDYEAKHILARLLSYDENRLQESLALYEKLLNDVTDTDPEIRIETAILYNRIKQYAKSIAVLEPLMDRAASKAPMYYFIDIPKAGLILSDAFMGLNNYKKAISTLKQIYNAHHEIKDIPLYLARAYAANNNFVAAEALYDELLRDDQDNAAILSEKAGLDAILGRMASSRSLYKKALAVSGDNAGQAELKKKIRFDYAMSLNIWGDFYSVESMLEELIAETDDSSTKNILLMRSLAQVYISSERYNMAERIYRMLIHKTQDNESLIMDLAELLFASGDYAGAYKQADILLNTPVDKKSDEAGHALVLKAKIAEKSGDQKKALIILKKRLLLPDAGVDDVVLAARLSMEINDNTNGYAYFDKAKLMAPDNPAPYFYEALYHNNLNKNFLESILNHPIDFTGNLMIWAGLYQNNSYFKEALILYDKCLETDPDYFPALLAKAETLSFIGNMDASLKIYDELNAVYPENRKIMLGRARVLSWNRQYKESLKAYSDILKINKDNRVLLEAARVAAWSKDMNKSYSYYEAVYAEPVDKEIQDRVNRQNIKYIPTIDALNKKCGDNETSIYDLYEKMDACIQQNEKNKEDYGINGDLSVLLTDLYADYRIQKEAFLEKKAKTFLWNQRFPKAIHSYEELIDAYPGNEEAMFDIAQAYCSLGMIQEEEKAYENLLSRKPFHNMAAEALKLAEIRNEPALSAFFDYWDEKGRDNVSGITRFRYELAAELPVAAKFRFSAKGVRWREEPDHVNKTYNADGFSLGLNWNVDAHVVIDGHWTHKLYKNDGPESSDTGHARLTYRFDNGSEAAFSYNLTDETYNAFGIMDGIQASTISASLRAKISRSWDIGLESGIKFYDDDNKGLYTTVDTGYVLTDHPRTLKAILSGTYRNTDEASLEIYRNDILVDIIHPYWTPEDHASGSFTILWRHDLSQDYYCGALENIYNFSVSFGIEDDGNTGVTLEGGWVYEFQEHMTLKTSGYLTRSNSWDATGINASFMYRF